ncbi:MAG: acetylglutamate kinase [Candidatus Omnitrophica bacterium]|nr:acetylglutamate kinase [Candidatus Omnitrophota bacterium]
MEGIIKKADVLIEALPYIQRFNKKIIVIKYGGAAMENNEMRMSTLEDIVFMHFVGMKPVLVHGGGPFINEKMQEAGKKPEFIDGHRVTDEHTVQIVEETLSELNKKIAREIRQLGALTESLGGRVDNLLKVKEQTAAQKKKFGYVGEIESVNPQAIKKTLNAGKIPVIYPAALDDKKEAYNVNADLAGAEIAVALKAKKFVLLTNTQGIMMNQDDEESLVSTLRVKEVKDLIKRGVIKGGMLPKVKACVEALKGGVDKTHIIDGRIPHSLLLEVFTDKGIGTEIVKVK